MRQEGLKCENLLKFSYSFLMENLQNPCYHYTINRLGAPLTQAVDILRRNILRNNLEKQKFIVASSLR
jgi:hypothetical protein